MEDSMQLKMNGLHSGTMIMEKEIGNGVREQYHEHPESGDIVVLHVWYGQDGDSVTSECEVYQVYPYTPGMADGLRSIASIYRSLDRHTAATKQMKELAYAS